MRIRTGTVSFDTHSDLYRYSFFLTDLSKKCYRPKINVTGLTIVILKLNNIDSNFVYNKIEALFLEPDLFPSGPDRPVSS